jgi:hypothetical protein
MAQVCIQVADNVAAEVREALLDRAGYDEGQISQMSAAQKTENARLHLVEYAKSALRDYRSRKAPASEVS